MAYRKTVWLIDDQEISNHLTEHTLKINQFCSDVCTFTDGQEALSELEVRVKAGVFPDYIFLDLNMPVLNGWGFLEAYRKFPEEMKESCTVYILSSSVDEEDIQKSRQYKEVRDFLIKPLDKVDLEALKFQAGKVPHHS